MTFVGNPAEGTRALVSLLPKQHMAMGDMLLAQSEYPGNSPEQRLSRAVIAQAHFAAAQAKITALAVFDHDFEGEVAEELERMRAARQAARERMGR